MSSPGVAVIALGGNALIKAGQQGTIREQIDNIRGSLRGILELIEQGWTVLLTHGNGPQVGNMLLMVEAARGRAPELPLGVCVADTEGSLGYLIQQELINGLHERGLKRNVVTLITQVLVDAGDPAFHHATKPIGPYLTQAEAVEFERQRGWEFIEVAGKGWRRVVPSPHPVEIIERDSIVRLLEGGDIVIAVGGGGIPVRQLPDGRLQGVDAVIDKDLSAALVARQVRATHLALLTSVDCVYVDFGGPRQRPLQTACAAEMQRYLEAGEFPEGSMGPKVQAAIEFVRGGGERAVITHLDGLPAAFYGQGKATVITP